MEEYVNLGVQTNYYVAKSTEKVLQDINKKLQRIGVCLLAPMKTVDSKTHSSCHVFRQKNVVAQKIIFSTLDRKIKSTGRKCLNLPVPELNPSTSAIT